MRRTARLGLGLALGLVLGSGCWDFDGRYQVVAAELADAGACHQPLCLYASYTGSDVFIRDSFNYYPEYRVSAGVVGSSLDDLVVYTAAGDETIGEFTHALLHFVDGGLAGRADITQRMFRYSRGVEAVGVPSSLWAVSTAGAVRFQDYATPGLRVDSCLDGGSLYGAYQVSATEAYFTGDNALCRWTGGTTSTQLFPADRFDETTYLNTAWVTPQGTVLAGGCARDGGYCFSRVFLGDGGAPAIPDDYDFEDYGLMSVSGAGTEVWAGSRTGVIFQRTASGAYQVAHTASYTLLDLQAAGSSDVWAVGDNGLSAVHFDGTSWTEVALPPAVGTTTRWERVHPVPGGLVVAGAMDSPDAGGMVPVVRLYRRGN